MTELAVKEQFVELRGSGLSFASIAEKLNVSKTTLIQWSKIYQADIRNLRQVYAEALRERFRLTSERRASIFAKQLDTIEAELAKRDYATLSTEKLFDMSLRLHSELGATEAPLHFTGYEDMAQSILAGNEVAVNWEA